eukprot:387140_1
MRNLGYQHKFQYLLSFDISTNIQNNYNNKINGENIIKWAESNTKNMLNDGILIWMHQGLTFNKLGSLHNDVENEIITINELYNSNNSVLKLIYDKNMKLDKMQKK